MRQKDKAMLQKLEDERARLLRQVEALQNEVRGLDRAIALYQAESGQPKQRPKNVKQAIQRIMEDAGLVGASVDEVVVTAKNQGVHLERGTVASNLSRGKAEGTYAARDGRYYFRAGPRALDEEAFASVN